MEHRPHPLEAFDETGVSRLDLERLIGKVAEQHDVLLRLDDPILVAVTLNDMLLARALARIGSEVTAAQDQIAAGTAQNVAASKTIAERLINSAADYVAGQVRAATADGAEQLRAAIASDFRHARETAKTAQDASRSACWAAAIAIAAAAIVGTLAAVSPLLFVR